MASKLPSDDDSMFPPPRFSDHGVHGPSCKKDSDCSLSVWAPFAKNVDLVLFDSDCQEVERVSMRNTGDDFHCANQSLPAGTLYAFSLDGGECLPDPRSRRLPYGIHGPSQIWHPDKELNNTDWPGKNVLSGVMYELHIGTFSEDGTFDGAIQHLDYLVDLGVDCVEVMPLAPFPGKHGWGYDGVSPYAIHEPYGGPDGLQRFVHAAHQRGLGVCVDVVLNHLGPVGNYLQQFGPYFADKHSTPWGDGFNTDSDGCHNVRDYLVGVPLMFFQDFLVDAIRLDAVHALKDDSEPHILAQLSQATDKLRHIQNRPLTLIAESDLNDCSMVMPIEDGGLGLDAQWDDDVHHSVHVAFTGEKHGYFEDFSDPDALRKTFEEVFYHNGTYSTFRGTHWGATVPDDFNRSKFIVFSGNHDQVGNRALGDRPSTHLPAPLYAAQAAFILLGPYTPMLFMGEEWAATTNFQYFTDYEDASMGEAVTKGRQEEFSSHGWESIYGEEKLIVPDPQAEKTFQDSCLDWNEQNQENHQRMLRWYKDLIALRHSERDISQGRQPKFVQGDNFMALVRGSFVIIASTSNEPLYIDLDDLYVTAQLARKTSSTPKKDSHSSLNKVGAESGQQPDATMANSALLKLSWDPDNTVIREKELTVPALSAAIVKFE